MKSRVILGLSASMLMVMLAFTGCESGQTEPEKPVQTNSETAVSESDSFSVYQPVIDAFYKLASGQYEYSTEDESDIPKGGMGILEGNGFGSSDSMLWKSGFVIRDLSGDGVPELLIGSVEEKATEGDRTAIYAIYTIADDREKFVLDGTYRNMYYLCENGSLFNQGSAGAAYSIFGLYDLTKDGQSLLCRDFYFTHEKDGNFDNIRCWHNTVGEMNPAVSVELDITLDEFWEMEEKLSEQTVTIEMTSFGEYGGVEKPVLDEGGAVSPVYARDYTGECDEYTLDTTDYAAKVVFTAKSAVRNFKLISLTVKDISEDGNVSYSFDDLYVYGDLTADKGLAVTMNLPEIIPFYGISYTDGVGNTRVFSINLSGFDGSLYLTEISGVG